MIVVTERRVVSTVRAHVCGDRRMRLLPLAGRCMGCGGKLTTTFCPPKVNRPEVGSVVLCVRCVERALAEAACIVHWRYSDGPGITLVQWAAQRRAYVQSVAHRAEVCPLCGGGRSGRRCICEPSEEKSRMMDAVRRKKVADEQMAWVCCRACGWSGRVQIRKWKRPGHAAVTGVPCPKCGRHRLKRLSAKVEGA